MIGLAAITVATRTTITSSEWIGRPFPGFVLIDNRVIASVGLAHWSGTFVPGLYQSEVVAVDGQPVGSTAEIYARVRSAPPGALLRYHLLRGGHERDVEIATQLFNLRDWLLLFGTFLLNGGTWLAAGLVVWVLRPRAPLGQAFLVLGASWAFFLLTAMDLYGPATFFRLHVGCEALVPPAVLQFALLFPQPHRFASWRLAGYLSGVAIGALYERFLYLPWAYSAILYANMTWLGLVGVFFGVRLVWEYWQGGSSLARQRVRVVTLGTLCGFAIPGAIVLMSVFTGGGFGINAGAFTQFLFPLAVAYAVMKHDLFALDAMVKRGAYYLVLTGGVGAAYLAAVVLLDVGLKGNAITTSPVFPLLFTLVVLLVFNPLRTRLQAFVDRVFFRTAYDGARELAAVGRQLASTLQQERIVALVRSAVEHAIPNGTTRLFVRAPDGRLAEAGGGPGVPPALGRALDEGRVITVYDAAELYPDLATHEAVRAALTTLGAEVAVPLRLRGELVGILTAGAKRTGLFYTAGDAEFLRALAQQAAIALENARTYEALALLNARLEDRVRERTAQLEEANHELAQAYGELKSAETRLVHSEKMASLGRLVAGVAHEINNPVSFISTSVAPLTRRLQQAAAGAPPQARGALREAEELAGIMARGAARTAAIVKDLRSFSRLGEATRKAVDLHEGLEVTLRLLEPRWRERITVHRDYGALPPVECDPGQLNQVFMNLLTNACDAIAGTGNIWVTTRAEGGAVSVAIRDDGAGIPPAVLGRIFDPFFTTKDVGRGTGLGLAVSHAVVAAHGGRIDVESAPGAGSTFRVVLPLAAAGARLAQASG
ncbi:MAG TPA: ATP-binding protein [Verrucomicrobiae bacterium]|nr:ATP-binding protein [Verrucomicrobiae bacterium]